MIKVTQLLLAALIALSGARVALAQHDASTKPIGEHERAVLFPTAHMLDRGRSVAETACQKCHGLDGMGKGAKVPVIAGQRAVYLYRVLKAYQDRDRHNETMMHISSLLNDDALESVAAYYANQTFEPQEKAEAPDTADTTIMEDDPFTGIRPTIKKCSKCHGDTGNSTASGVPNLTTQSTEVFVAAMQAYADGSRNNRLMGRFASKLDEQSMKELGLYYAVQKPVKTEDSGDGDAAAGKKIAGDCAQCHGDDGNASSAKTPSLAGQDARYLTKAIAAYQDENRQHEGMHKAVAGLSETQVKDLAAFYAGQEPKQRQVRTPLTTRQWLERCERCHGVNGNSTDPRFPALAGQKEEYLRATLQAYESGGRQAPAMHVMTESLSATDIERIARHYASLQPKSVLYIRLPCPPPSED